MTPNGNGDYETRYPFASTGYRPTRDPSDAWPVAPVVKTLGGTGWSCPRCFNVYAPWVPECSRCNSPAATTTTNAVPPRVRIGQEGASS